MGDDFLSISNISSAEKGLGTELINELKKIASEKELGIEVYSIPEAMGFYKKMGFFREEGSRRFFIKK